MESAGVETATPAIARIQRYTTLLQSPTQPYPTWETATPRSEFGTEAAIWEQLAAAHRERGWHLSGSRRLSHGRQILAILAITLLGSCSCHDRDLARRPARASQEDELRRLLDRLREETGAPGAILGVLSGRNPPLVVASGQADRDANRRMDPGDPYFLGSITKTYTAVTVLRLAEEGRLSLDDTLDRFFPSFPDGSKITLRHLLAQTSGLKDF